MSQSNYVGTMLITYKELFIKWMILFFICIINYNFAYADLFEENKIYLTSEMDFGNYVGFDLNLNVINKETYSFKIGYNHHFQKPRNSPENFSPGLVNLLLLGLGSPYDQIKNYQITFGIINSFNQSGTIRANFSVGIGYTTLIEPVNWKPDGDGIIGANYTWEYKERNNLSLIFNYKFEFLIKKYAGSTISPMIIINSERIYYGIGFGIMIGYIRD